MANAILCVVGVGLVFIGCWFLTQHSEREPKIEVTHGRANRPVAWSGCVVGV